MENENLPVYKLIDNHLRTIGKSFFWLVRQTNYSYKHLYMTIRGKSAERRPLTRNMLNKINAALNTDFVLPEDEANYNQLDEKIKFAKELLTDQGYTIIEPKAKRKKK